MTNKDISSLLKEIAVYNPFKVRAFEQAARTIEACPEEAVVLAGEGRLTEIKGIGKGVEEVILDFIKTGKAKLLEELKAAFPPTLPELLSIPGVGPKKVKALWEKLGISTLGELEYACKENRLLSLDGFGEKTQVKILKGISFRARYREMYLFNEALARAREAVKLIERTGLFGRIAIAGSLRRGKSIFKDVDVVLVPEEGVLAEQAAMAVASLSDPPAGAGGEPQGVPAADLKPDGVLGAGPTKVSIRRGGLQMDFRIVPLESYPFALQHFTGSKDHNTLLRGRAKRMGLKMNEYGLFKDPDGPAIPLAAENEGDVYRLLSLAYIPPELREGGGEIEAAHGGRLPRLVERADLRGMIHVHSSWSDGLQSIDRLAQECILRGFSYLCLSDHSRSAFYARGLSIEAVLSQKEEVGRLNRALSPFKIFFGIESDILSDGKLDYPDEVLAEFDFVIGSVHSRLGMGEEEATERLIAAVENPYLTVLGHVSGRLLLSREGYPYAVEPLIEAMKRHGVALEHNCNPHRLDPDWPILKRAAAEGVSISLGPDAHASDGLDDIEYGLVMARKAWCEARHILNCFTVEEMDGYLKRRRKEKGL
jgi:DNA polymerase (family 10)